MVQFYSTMMLQLSLSAENTFHLLFAVDTPLACSLGYIYYKLPLTSFMGSIFAIYTSLPWFIYNINLQGRKNSNPIVVAVECDKVISTSSWQV